MGEVLCSTENSPFLIIDHIHAKINRVCCAALAIGKRCMNVRKNKLFTHEHIMFLDCLSQYSETNKQWVLDDARSRVKTHTSFPEKNIEF